MNGDPGTVLKLTHENAVIEGPRRARRRLRRSPDHGKARPERFESFLAVGTRTPELDELRECLAELRASADDTLRAVSCGAGYYGLGDEIDPCRDPDAPDHRDRALRRRNRDRAQLARYARAAIRQAQRDEQQREKQRQRQRERERRQQRERERLAAVGLTREFRVPTVEEQAARRAELDQRNARAEEVRRERLAKLERGRHEAEMRRREWDAIQEAEFQRRLRIEKINQHQRERVRALTAAVGLLLSRVRMREQRVRERARRFRPDDVLLAF